MEDLRKSLFSPTSEHLSITSVIWRQEDEFCSDSTPARCLFTLSLSVAPWVALIELWETAPLTVENLPPWHLLPPPDVTQQSQHLLLPRYLLMSLSIALDQHLPLINKAFPTGDRATQVTLTFELKSGNNSIWSREEQCISLSVSPARSQPHSL